MERGLEWGEKGLKEVVVCQMSNHLLLNPQQNSTTFPACDQGTGGVKDCVMQSGPWQKRDSRAGAKHRVEMENEIDLGGRGN